MQRSRRANPYPFTWEIPTAALIAFILTIVLAAQTGRSVANLIAGNGWTYAPRAELFTSLPGILTGDATTGLTGITHPVSPSLLRVSIAAVVVAALALTLILARLGWSRWGPTRLHGMATRAETDRLLGPARLRRTAAVLRPDLHRRGTPNVLRRVPPVAVGWRLGTAHEPRAGQLWVPWDRTAGVIGPQGSGKTLDLLAPALIDAPGAALTTLTKVDDLLLTFTSRSTNDRPCVVLDPFTLVPALPEVLWDPINGCVDPLIAERRAKAFTAGTVKGAVAGGHGDDAARFYAAEAAKVLQGFFHAAALTGRTLEHVLRWVAKPLAASEPAEILREHPHAAPFWDGLLYAALHGDERTAGNTITTVQQAMSLFFQDSIRRRCTPTPGRPATDIADIITRRGTIYLLGREDPYASASPLMTAFAEHVLDTALHAANTSPWGRLCPPFHAILDELPSTAPLPTLRTRMANERALGISFMWAAQAWPQLAAIFGEQEARTLLGLTNNLIVFGGSKDVAFNQEISDLLGQVRITRTTWQTGRMPGRQVSADDIPILTPAELRQLPERRALVLAENTAPIIAKLTRCIDGKPGRRLLADQTRLRADVAADRGTTLGADERTAIAHAEARRIGLANDREEQPR